MTAVSERIVLSVADRLALEEQSCRYGLAFDAGDADAFLQVFCEDGVFEAVLTGESEPLTVLRGASELRAFVERGVPGGGAAVHVVSGLVVDDVGVDEVRTRSSVVVTKQLRSGPAVVTHGSYHDLWRREPDGWRIAHRRYVSAGYPPYRPSTREASS
jgi:hypothetical protein